MFRTLGTGDCIICMERTADVLLPCVHSFCLVCTEQWKAMGKDWCPLCREPLQLDGKDTWVTPEDPESDELRNYLMALAEPN